MRLSRNRAPLVIALALLVLALAAARDLTRLGNALPWRTMDEFADFYCAGSALDERASPYTYEPLRTCEHKVNVGGSFRGRLFAENATVAVPAPQPAYDFLPFMALAHLPAAAARVVDGVAILAAIALCAVALAALGVPLDLAVAALVLSTAFVELNTAQIVPFALLALVLCGYFLARRRDALAGIAASLTAIEPTVGVPVIAAALLFAPRARWAAVSTAATLALVFFGLVGGAGVVHYFSRVLPAHAASEIHFPSNISLTYAFALVGLFAGVRSARGRPIVPRSLDRGLLIAPRVTSRRWQTRAARLSSGILLLSSPGHISIRKSSASRCRRFWSWRSPRGKRTNRLCDRSVRLSIPWILVWGMKQLLLAASSSSAPRFFCACASHDGLRVCDASARSCRPVSTPSSSTRRIFRCPRRGAYVRGRQARPKSSGVTMPGSAASAIPLWFAIKVPDLGGAACRACDGRSLQGFDLALASASSHESLRETPRLRPASRRARTGSSADRLLSRS